MTAKETRARESGSPEPSYAHPLDPLSPAEIRLARDVADRDLLIPALGEQPRGRVGDDLARAGLLAFAQAWVGHAPSITNID